VLAQLNFDIGRNRLMKYNASRCKNSEPKSRARREWRYGQEAVRNIQNGRYSTPSDRSVEIAGSLEDSVRGTVTYRPDCSVPEFYAGSYQTKIEVENETTLSAAKRLLTLGHKPVALNFASATHPGGGFLSGARAQEEYLARSIGLYACLRITFEFQMQY
jgi:uncharacterized protein (TIGR02452 family)